MNLKIFVCFHCHIWFYLKIDWLLELKLGKQTNLGRLTLMLMFIFCCFWPKTSFFFFCKFGQKNLVKFLFFSYNLLSRLIRIYSLGWWYCFYCFSLDRFLLGKYDPKIQDCLFKNKYSTETNSRMLNSIVMFIFSNFDWKCSF